jgi:RND family efflux transporter MFP subunit
VFFYRKERKMLKKKSLVSIKFILLSLLTVALSACDSSSAAIDDEVIKPVKLYQIPTLKGTAHDAFLAEVDAGNRSHLSFQVAGVVEQLKVKQGQHVKQGELLIALDPIDYQLAMDSAQAQFDFANTHYKRDKQLFEKKLISANAFDKTETDYKTALANLDKAQTDLSFTQIKAPFDGIISLSFAKKYQYVKAKQTVLNIINNDTLDINISLPVPYVDQVGLDALKKFSLSVSFDIQDQIMIPATFKEMSTQPNSDTNSYSATVEIKRPAGMNILTGMTGKVFIHHAQKNLILQLPEGAWVTKSNTRGSVWRLDPNDNSVHKVEIEINAEGALSGDLQSGDLIITAGAKGLYEGQIVRAWEREAGI